jgi:TPR repeat protein
MKRILTALVLLTGLFGAGGAVWAGDFDKVMKAIKSKDYATALKELRPLAEQGNAEAQFGLGALYENGGKGVLQDTMAAHMWFNIAVANGYPRYFERDRVERVADKLSSSELVEAEKRAKRCMESKYKDCEAEPKSWWQKLLD